MASLLMLMFGSRIIEVRETQCALQDTHSVSQIFGRRASAVGSSALVVTGSLVASLAQNMQMLAIARGTLSSLCSTMRAHDIAVVINGIGAGGIIAVSQVALPDMIPVHKTAFYSRLVRL